jgi:hypothetical protein
MIALAHYAIVYACAWTADSIHARVLLAAENDRLQEERAPLREELRIKDTRMGQITPQRRPHYGPHERIAILELLAARVWLTFPPPAGVSQMRVNSRDQTKHLV